MIVATHICNACGGQVRFIDRKPFNVDGSSHWDVCKQRQFAAVRKKGAYFETAFEGGYIYKGHKWLTWMRMPAVTGSQYKPDGCDCGLPAWELCEEVCQHAIQ